VPLMSQREELQHRVAAALEFDLEHGPGWFRDGTLDYQRAALIAVNEIFGEPPLEETEEVKSGTA